MKIFTRIFLVPIALMLLLGMTASAVPVSLELLLLVDVSGSISDAEFNLQKTGYVNAFQDPTIQAAIASFAGSGGIAVSLVQFSGAAQQAQSIGWMQLTDAASANAFAAAVNIMGRAFSGNTAPGSAINFAAPLFNNNGFEGARKVIDISGDGAANEGANTLAAATAANAAGIIINGLPIGDASLQAWYQANIVTPGGGFLVAASGFATFGDAVALKIGSEINNQDPLPEPSTYAMLGAGLLVLVGLKRRKA